jgi:hypothetical protein
LKHVAAARFNRDLLVRRALCFSHERF